jgi:two-component sensor histidine kinase
MKLTWLIIQLFFLSSISLFAQEEQELIRRMERSDSRERILGMSVYSDGNVFSNGRTPEKFRFLLKEAYRIAERDGDKEFKEYLEFYSRMRNLMFIPIKDLQASEAVVLKYWQKALSYYESKGDERFAAICYAQLGESYFLQKQFGECIENLLKAKALFQKVGYHRFPMIGRYLHQTALIFYFFRQYDKVVELMEVAVQQPIYNENYAIQRYNTLGAAYMHLKQSARAEEAFIQTINEAITYKDNIWVALGSGYLARLYIGEGKYQEALHLYESTLKYMEEFKDVAVKEYSEHLLGLAKAHVLLGQLPQARKSLERINFKDVPSTRELHVFGKSHQDINYWLTYYDVQHQYHRAAQNYAKAYLYQDSLYKFKYMIDSTFNRLEVDVVQNRLEAQKERYENEERATLVKTQNQLLQFFVILVIVVVTFAFLLFLRSRKVKSQNWLINQQLGSLQKILDQKQVLLKELQHRVKNNLQYVISILEIQRESVDYNTIDEVVRENQNRIHSMALLHSKLNSMDEVNMVNLIDYLSGLTGLVKDSYGGSGKDIELSLHCEIEYLAIEKALPLGLIIVELMSNSIKHAFGNRSEGAIEIALKWDEANQQIQLIYKDDGSGFNFNTTSTKGLGMEIIRGLIAQLEGIVESSAENGFELKVSFVTTEIAVEQL